MTDAQEAVPLAEAAAPAPAHSSPRPPAAVPTIALARPSIVPTALVSFFFGLFGLIPAIIHARIAAARGYPTGRYWGTFAAAMAASLIVWIGGSMALVAANGGSSGPTFVYSVPTMAAAGAGSDDGSTTDGTGTDSSGSYSGEGPAVTWNSEGAFTSSSYSAGSQFSPGTHAVQIPFDNSANEEIEYTTLVNEDHSDIPTPLFEFPDGNGCTPILHGIPIDAQAPAGRTGSLTFGCLPPGNYVLASVRADQLSAGNSGAPIVADDAWQFSDLTIESDPVWDGVCMRGSVTGSDPWSMPSCS